MPDLNVKFSVQIPGGSTVQSDRKIPVEAFKKMDVTLPPNADKKSVFKFSDDSSEDTETINFLLIHSTLYSSTEQNGGKIFFEIEGLPTEADLKKKEGGLTKTSLSQPLLLIGEDIIKALKLSQGISLVNSYPSQQPKNDKGGKPTTEMEDLTTKNTAQVTIMVGRAVPPPPPKTEEETQTEEETAKENSTGGNGS